ncbi:DUF6266 family protein [Pedobacter sp. GR22-6]|uniref:DUF6266 family protein n=1 Tax=Pedobacter sp. GR22-6 TaxID=3127957 RepID=UPI00307F2E4A
MATYNNGINGPLKGKIGNVVAVNWRGVNHFRSLPEASAKPPTQKQLEHWKVFGMVSSWLKPLKDLIWIGFQTVTSGKTPMNEAISFVFREALKSEGTEREINFPMVVFSRGELFSSYIREFSKLDSGLIRITWQNGFSSAFHQENDRAIFIFYNVTKGKFATYKEVADRGDQEALLQLPGGFAHDELHGYLFYMSMDGKAVSTTQYLGNL